MDPRSLVLRCLRLATLPIESPHPYGNNGDCTYDNKSAGFKFHFTLMDMERDFGYVYVKDAQGNVLNTYTGTVAGGFDSACVPTSTGSVQMVSDPGVTGQGFTIDSVTRCCLETELRGRAGLTIPEGGCASARSRPPHSPLGFPQGHSGGEVVRVVDGDTVDVRLPAGVTMRVRLLGIDAPEVYNGVERPGRNAFAPLKVIVRYSW